MNGSFRSTGTFLAFRVFHLPLSAFSCRAWIGMCFAADAPGKSDVQLASRTQQTFRTRSGGAVVRLRHRQSSACEATSPEDAPADRWNWTDLATRIVMPRFDTRFHKVNSREFRLSQKFGRGSLVAASDETF
jgi:hypothetical protein